jgi:hypothetical protein
MGILSKLVWIFLNLMCVGIDVAILFLVCHLVLMWYNISWLRQLDNAGKALVNDITTDLSQYWGRVIQKQLSEKSKLLLSIVVLSLVRLALSEVGRLF